MLPCPENLTQCPADFPQDPYDANNNPVYLNVCHPGHSVCPVPAAPVVTGGSGLAQEATLQATIRSDRNATKIWVWGQYQTPTGAWVSLWPGGKFESVQDAPHDAGETVEIGLSGLLQDGVNHRFFFAHCNQNNCTCTSPVTEYDDTNGFSTVGPANPTDPTGQQRFVEDTFFRRETYPKIPIDIDGDGVSEGPGDGLGPAWESTGAGVGSAAWMAEICDTGGVNCLSGAIGNPSSILSYEKSVAAGPKAYTEALLRNDLDSEDNSAGYFNINIEAWRQPGQFNGSPVIKSYAVKIVKGYRDCDDATMFIARFPSEYGLAACGQGDPPGMLVPIYTTCAEEPPLGVEDPNYPGWSKPVWMRIQLSQNHQGYPVIEGWVAWDCTDGQDIDSCDHKCNYTRIDTATDEDGALIPGISGGWGMSIHDFDAFIDIFRAGGEAVGFAQ